ncbi:MAG: GAF domain-containing protein [Bryobacterales bacterium]|nr:GAF domain-containing protein [Bryobacterales bacterium]
MNTEAVEELDTTGRAEPSGVSDPPVDRSPSDRGDSHLEFLRRISGRLAVADPLHEVLDQIVEFLNAVIGADSCFVYLLEEQDLVLRASKNPHPESVDNLRIRVGQGITGWVAENREAVAIAQDAMGDSRFRVFRQLPEDGFQAILSVPILAGGRLIGVLNLQHRARHEHSQREINLVSTIGNLVGAEVERARLDCEVAKLTGQLETRKLLERAKGILQRDLSVTEEQAYLKLQQESRRRRIPMKQVAEAVVLSDDLRRPQSS